jgi:D-xylose reductase
MEELVREGLVKNIGLCNVGTSTLRDVLNYAEVKPTVLQVEMHPYLTQEKLLRFCRLKGIAVTAFSNLGAGSYVPLGMAAIEESCLNEPVI